MILVASEANLKVSLPQLLLPGHPFGIVELPERMIWTSSSLKLFRKCKRKFFWRYIMRLRPKYKAGSLIIGSAFHDALEQWYKSKRSSMAKLAPIVIDEHRAELDGDLYNESDWDDLKNDMDTAIGMLMGYAQCYSNDRDTWTIKPGQIEVPFSIDMGEFDFQGKIDLIASVKGKQFIVEHKTAGRIEESYIDRLPLDTQVRAYIFGATRGLSLKPGYVLYDVVKKCKLRRKANETVDGFSLRIAEDYMCRPSWYFYREELRFNTGHIQAFEYEMRQTQTELMSILKGNFGDPKNPRTWGPNDSTCTEFFKTCEYMNACTGGLDRGTSIKFQQIDTMHEELVEAGE